jgi:hypothetical protein
VRWWNPFEESVPWRPVLPVPRVDARGVPAFAYRDVHGIEGPRDFCARNRVNGHFARLNAAYGDTESYGPPKHVHTFFNYVPPQRYFAAHAEYFSEIAGLRTGDASQLCLTDSELADLVHERLESFIEQGRREALEARVLPPRLYALSQNDWGRACGCVGCAAADRRAGSAAGSLIAFVNEIAGRIEEDHPEVRIDTLAYAHTFPPPTGLRARDNVVVRLAALYERDFSKPVDDPANRVYLEAIEGWSAVADHLRIWEYSVTFGPAGDLPLPNVAFLAEDFRTYLERGIEGIFVQHWFPIEGDLHDLKRWVLIKLLEDPYRDPDRLVRDFTSGFYGPAGRHVRRYLRDLSRAARRHPARIGFDADAEAFAYLDAGFIVRQQGRFDRAAAAVRGRPRLEARLRHARLALDRATLHRWEILKRQWSERQGGLLPLVRSEVEQRYRATRREQAALRLPEAERIADRERLETELRNLAAVGGGG